MPHTEKRYKKGEIICRPKEMVMSMYNILYGSVGVYFDYGMPEQVEVVTLQEGDFFNVISFLESRPRNTTVVALEPLAPCALPGMRSKRSPMTTSARTSGRSRRRS